MSAVISRTSDPTPHLEEVSPASLGPADTRVKVAAAGFTLFDAFSAANHALLGLPDVIGHGFDFSGTVIEVGAEVHALAPRDRVAGVHAETITAARAQATEVVVPAADVARLPPRLSLDRAAAVAAQRPHRAAGSRPPQAGRRTAARNRRRRLDRQLGDRPGNARWLDDRCAHPPRDRVPRAGGRGLTRPHSSTGAGLRLDRFTLRDGLVVEGVAYFDPAPFRTPSAGSRDIRAFAAEYDKAWQARDPDAIAAHHAEEGTYQLHVAGLPPVQGREAMRAAFAASLASWQTASFEFDKAFYGDSFFVWQSTMRGVLAQPLELGAVTIPANGATLSLHGVDVITLNPDGLIQAKETHFDLVAAANQARAT